LEYPKIIKKIVIPVYKEYLAYLCFDRKLKAIMQIHVAKGIRIYNWGKLKYLPMAIPHE